jgi:chitinase
MHRSTYHVTRLDMDVESSSLTNTTGIVRRNEAIKLVEHWAAARRIRLQIQDTIPVLPTGSRPAAWPCCRTPLPPGRASTS